MIKNALRNGMSNAETEGAIGLPVMLQIGDEKMDIHGMNAMI